MGNDDAQHRVIGLTGGIGVGKSTVAALLAELGATIVDCDNLGRLVVEPGGLAYQGVLDHFGEEILQDDGSFDRAALGSRVFSDHAELAALNAITHPAIDIEIANRIRSAAAGPVVLDMAILVETELGAGQYQSVLVVEAPLEVRLERLRSDRGMTDEQSMARITSQADDEARRAVADHIIVNDATLAELTARVAQFWTAAGL